MRKRNKIIIWCILCFILGLAIGFGWGGERMLDWGFEKFKTLSIINITVTSTELIRALKGGCDYAFIYNDSGNQTANR